MEVFWACVCVAAAWAACKVARARRQSATPKRETPAAVGAPRTQRLGVFGDTPVASRVRVTAGKRGSPGRKGRNDETGKEPTMERARDILSQVCGFFDADDVRYRSYPDGTGIEAVFCGETAPFTATVMVREEPLVLGVLIRVPIIVPEARRVQMAETVVRANDRLLVGAFDLNMTDGMLAFRASIPLAEASIVHEQFRDLMRAALWSVDRYHRAFCRLLYGDDLSPAEVIAEVEMAGHGSAR